MAYVSPNFKTKAAFKKAVKEGQQVRVFYPGIDPGRDNGIEFIEGPHYPEPHKWYAKVSMTNRIVTKVS